MNEHDDTTPAPDAGETTWIAATPRTEPIPTPSPAPTPVPTPPSPVRPSDAGQDTPEAVTGVHWRAVVWGLACMVAAAFGIGQAVTGLVIDWPRVGPWLFGSIGALLIVAGAWSVLRRPGTSGSPGRP